MRHAVTASLLAALLAALLTVAVPLITALVSRLPSVNGYLAVALGTLCSAAEALLAQRVGERALRLIERESARTPTLYALPALAALSDRARWGRGLGLGLLIVSVVEGLACVVAFVLALGREP